MRAGLGIRPRIALLGVVTLLGLTGCVAGAPAGDAGQPEIGECFLLTQPAEITAASHSAPAVGCDSPHTHETFDVRELAGDIAELAERPDPLMLAARQDALCLVAALRTHMAAGPRDAVMGVEIRASFPSVDAWAAGERWVRCDAVTFADDEPMTLATSLDGIMRTDASAFVRRCYLQEPDAAGGWLPEGDEVPCSSAHTTQDVEAWVDAAATGMSPAAIAATCEPFVAEVLGGAPSELGATASGVLVTDGDGRTELRCTIGGDPDGGARSDAIIPVG